MGHPLERFYPYVPVWAQNMGISLYGLAWRSERLGGDFPQYVVGFQQRDRWSGDRFKAYLDERLRFILLRALDQVPYYQKKWADAGIERGDLEGITSADLFKLPITPKADLRVMPDSFVAEDTANKGKLHRYYSSGSTGTPVTHVCTADDHRRFIAAREVRSFGWAGATIHDGRSMVGGRLVVPKGISRPPFHRYNWAEKQVYFSAYHISRENLIHYVRAFNHHQPKLLTGYANSHYILARMMCEQGLTLNYQPDALVLSSEKLTAEMKSVMQRAFRARAYEEYGAVENCILATECSEGRLHLNSDFGIMEITDSSGNAVAPGEEGRILCTGLLNETQPLIRYEIGDVGIWSHKLCPCGRNHLPVLQEIVGRLEDIVIGPDGREMVRFHWIYIDLQNIIEGQVIQETLDQFTLKLVTHPAFGLEDEKIIRQRFAERLGNVKVGIERVPEIPRSERGKFRAVICKLSKQQREQARRAGTAELVHL